MVSFCVVLFGFALGLKIISLLKVLVKNQTLEPNEVDDERYRNRGFDHAGKQNSRHSVVTD